MDFIAKIENILREPLQALGYEIVRVQLRGNQRKTLELRIERLDRAPVRVEDCARASHEASAHLDIADPIENSYVLEVSSPGLDRSLVKKEDYRRFTQQTIKLNSHVPVEGARRFQGLLLGIENDEVLVKVESQTEKKPITIRVPFENIRDARLVPLIKGGNGPPKKKRCH